jgi:D-cysteine desulfhydrase
LPRYASPIRRLERRSFRGRHARVTDFFRALGVTLPTPVTECAALSTPHARFWLKNDGPTHPVFGGNKIRKLTHLLEEVEARGARRILTFGTVGSHHVLATALLARTRGIRTAAVLAPQPLTPHVEEIRRAIARQGVEVTRASSLATLPFAFLRAYSAGDYVLAPGAATPLGAAGYVEAVRELAVQIRSGAVPEPDVLVVPLGSGGTAAGLLAGIVHLGLATRVLAVTVVAAPFMRARVLGLSRRTLERLGYAVDAQKLAERLVVDRSELGRGYGHAPPDFAALAARAARDAELELDETYTSKAFARALRLVRDAAPRERPLEVLYWHTLSTAPLAPLLAQGLPP